MILSIPPSPLEHGCWNILEWPSQSPDLNPIENLWWDLKKAVAVRKPKNVTELEAFAHDEWAKIPVDRCKTLVSSYASRLKAVITVKGCCTNTKIECHLGGLNKTDNDVSTEKTFVVISL
uniref:Tc1-like transposase DDE domain-containing protein n=1 Tax=Leptobrachium leishanense TaxID=445787 RepID=A0A8C5Q5J6_9ANUR